MINRTPNTPPPLPCTLAACQFVGWLRTREMRGNHECLGPWRAVVGADGYGECWDRLLEVNRGRSCDRLVLNKLRRP